MMVTESPDFDQIYGQFRPRIHAYLTHLADAAEADDLCQEVYLKVERLPTT